MEKNQETDQALERLQSSEFGKQLLDAEATLQLLKAGQLPNIERTVARAIFNTRVITDESIFEKTDEKNMDSQQLRNSSKVTAYLALNLTGVPQATLFYPRNPSLNESQLFASYFPKLIAMMYSAIGLNVDQAANLSEQSLNKLLKQGLPKVS